MNSILNSEKGECFLCHRVCRTDKHHIFGASNRNKSEEYGLFVYLCPDCHTMAPRAVHRNQEVMDWLHEIGQEAYEKEYGDDFLQVFGRNYT